MNGRKIAVVSLVLTLLFTSLTPKSVSAQDIPLRDDQSPIVELCELLWEQSQGLFLVTCTWFLLIPFAYAPVSNVLPDPPTPTPEPSPTPPSFINYDEDGDSLTTYGVNCPGLRCDEYARITFNFEGVVNRNDRLCETPHGSAMAYRDGTLNNTVKNPYFISLKPLDSGFGYVAEIRRHTNSSGWNVAGNYDLAIFCAE